jgi:RND family efflux transporter MFP subunit
MSGVRAWIVLGVALVLAAMLGLYERAASRTNRVALAASPKPVTVERVQKATFRPWREYVGTLQPWGLARVGPQYVSAYVGTVLVRPGSTVKRGEVLATLDCRNASAATREIAARAHALEERQVAAAHETERMKQLVDGGYASANDIEQLTARTSAQSAEVEGMRASLASRSLEVDDCVLRAPFAGEVADRFVDPGGYVRPGTPVVTVIDRGTIRVTAEAPESDFAVVAPGVEVRLSNQAGGGELRARISRRAPAADESTRTIHFEIDVANPERALPVGTTSTIHIDVGKPVDAAAVSLRSATVRGDSASLFVVDGEVARKQVVPVLGEAGATLYLAPSLAAGARVVVEGRALLDDGDRVTAREAPP